MNVQITIPRTGPFSPAAVLRLSSLGIPDFHVGLGFRHPVAIYNTSIEAISRRGKALIEQLWKYSLERGYEHHAKNSSNGEFLLENLDHFLDSLLEHLDDCKKIVQSVHSPEDGKLWKKTFSEFGHKIGWYKNHVERVVNRLKHHQGRLRLLSFYWESGVTVGYFVEGVTPDNALGPDPVVHPGSNSAFSFARDLRFHLCGIYAVSESLHRTLKAINSAFVSKLADDSGKDTGAWGDLFEAAYQLPVYFFPDEITKPTPWVGKKEHEYSLRLPSLHKCLAPPNASKVVSTFHGDGVTRTFKVPYLARHKG